MPVIKKCGPYEIKKKIFDLGGIFLVRAMLGWKLKDFLPALLNLHYRVNYLIPQSGEFRPVSYIILIGLLLVKLYPRLLFDCSVDVACTV